MDNYLAAARRFRLRRLWGLTGGSSAAGAGWVLVGIGVVIAAIAAVVVDMLHRREL